MNKYYAGLLAGISVLLLYGGLLAADKKEDLILYDDAFYYSIEESKYALCREPVQKTLPQCSLTFQLELLPGYELSGVFTDLNWQLVEIGEASYDLTVETEEHAELITLDIQPMERKILYHLDVEGNYKEVCLAINGGGPHRLVNTLSLADLDAREGYTFLGWNTRPDGSGTMVSAGSRISWEENLELWAIWYPWEDEELFAWEKSGDGVILTGFAENISPEQIPDPFTIPGSIQGKPVYGIGSNAFPGLSCNTLILPEGLKSVEEDAFADSQIEELYFCDDLMSISEYSFRGNDRLTTLHLQAVKAPVYSSSYFSTFCDKIEALELDGGSPHKLVLFSGSSARFGYDSSRMEEAFPQYQVFNMGVFAYTNALPQLELIRGLMGEGDILLLSPEFDAAKRQFCTTNAWDYGTYALCESNYDLLSRLDLREYAQIFSAFNDYQQKRMGTTGGSYADGPVFYDEDHNPVSTPSYNREGDYIVYRPNAEDDTPVYGLEVVYTTNAFPEESFLLPLEEEIQKFKDQGIQTFLSYAPRNRMALSQDSTPEAIAELDQWFHAKLSIPILGSLEESLWDGRYLYGTDNHLSTEGASIRTEKLIEELREAGL